MVGRTMKRLAGGLRHPGAWVSAALLSLWQAGASAEGFGSASTGHFKAAPVPSGAEAEGGSDLILGMVPANTLFFITAAVIAVFWFTVGGGRRPRVGRRGP